MENSNIKYSLEEIFKKIDIKKCIKNVYDNYELNETMPHIDIKKLDIPSQKNEYVYPGEPGIPKYPNKGSGFNIVGISTVTTLNTSGNSNINNNNYIQAKINQDYYQKNFFNEYLQSPLYTQSSPLNPVDGARKNYTQHEIICLLEILKAWDFSISFILSQYNCENRKYILEIKEKITLYIQQLNEIYNAFNYTSSSITNSYKTDTITNIYTFIKIVKEHLEQLLNNKEKINHIYDDKISFNLDLD